MYLLLYGLRRYYQRFIFGWFSTFNYIKLPFKCTLGIV
uniref:Uncharacterized protein n=1 Tax=Anguilla anguilla TaxID=7936 RepID=A0A0E9T4P3_ANGAN